MKNEFSKERRAEKEVVLRDMQTKIGVKVPTISEMEALCREKFAEEGDFEVFWYAYLSGIMAGIEMHDSYIQKHTPRRPSPPPREERDITNLWGLI